MVRCCTSSSPRWPWSIRALEPKPIIAGIFSEGEALCRSTWIACPTSFGIGFPTHAQRGQACSPRNKQEQAELVRLTAELARNGSEGPERPVGQLEVSFVLYRLVMVGPSQTDHANTKHAAIGSVPCLEAYICSVG